MCRSLVVSLEFLRLLLLLNELLELFIEPLELFIELLPLSLFIEPLCIEPATTLLFKEPLFEESKEESNDDIFPLRLLVMEL